MKTKRCTKCNEVKPLDEFHKRKKCKYGRRTECKICGNAQDRARYAKNPEKILKQARIRRAKDPEKFRAWSRVYEAKNPEKRNAQQRALRAKNLERYRNYDRTRDREKAYAKQKARIAENPEKYRATNRKSYLKRRKRLWQSKPRTPKELIEMCRMLLSKLLKAGKQKDYEQLKSLRAKCNQLRIMLG